MAIKAIKMEAQTENKFSSNWQSHNDLRNQVTNTHITGVWIEKKDNGDKNI